MTNDNSPRLELPGFGMPLTQLPELGEKYFMHALVRNSFGPFSSRFGNL